MPHVASLINKSSIKKFRNNQHIKPLKCNCTNKTNCSLKGKCQFECIVYKVEVHSCGSNHGNISRNIKKVYIGSTQGPFKKDIIIIEVSLHVKYIDRHSLFNIVYLTMWGKLRRI